MFVLDKNDRRPLYIQLRDSIRAAIHSGELGRRLPSSRKLAAELHISRGCVDAAYQAIIDEGLAYSVRGQGTFLSPSVIQNAGGIKYNEMDWHKKIINDARHSMGYNENINRPNRSDDVISFASLAPDHETFAVEDFKKAINSALAREGGFLLNYGYVRGYQPLRDYLQQYLSSKGINFKNQELLIVNGFRQGLWILSRILIPRGGRVIMDAPGYNGAIGIFRARDAEIIGIPPDEQGMDANILRKEIARGADAVYVAPSYQNPTGLNMSAARRTEILEICSLAQVPVIEDGFSEELRYKGEAFSSLKSSDSGSCVAYIGSFSKILFPGLRVGWIVADTALTKYILNEKFLNDIHTGMLQQAGLYEFLVRGYFQKHIRAARRIYRERLNCMAHSLDKHLNGYADWTAPDGGFSIFVRLRGDINARDMLDAAVAAGVKYAPGDVFFPNGGGENCLRLGFSRLTPDKIQEGIRRLANIIKNNTSI